MQDMSAQALRVAVINAVTTDPQFHGDLLKDGADAVRTRFGDQPLEVKVRFEKENELPILVPARSDKLARSIANVVKELGDRSPTRGEFEAVVVHKAWTDAAFRAGLESDPQAAIDGLLGSYGTSVPAGTTVRLYQEQPGECLVVVPRPVETGAELTDAELEAVAGGEGVAIALTGAIVGAVASVVVDRILPEML